MIKNCLKHEPVSCELTTRYHHICQIPSGVMRVNTLFSTSVLRNGSSKNLSRKVNVLICFPTDATSFSLFTDCVQITRTRR